MDCGLDKHLDSRKLDDKERIDGCLWNKFEEIEPNTNVFLTSLGQHVQFKINMGGLLMFGEREVLLAELSCLA